MRLELAATVQRGRFTLQLEGIVTSGACGVFGPSGCGKSSLLGLLAGLVRPARGRVVLDGEVLDDIAAGLHVPTHRRRIGVVFQQGHLLPHLDVQANLRYGERLLALADRRVGFPEVVALLDLAGLLDRRSATLSGGERQRVALGRALLCSPRLLLLDEPLAALDGGLKKSILPYLRRAREAFDLPMLHVSHDLPELLHTCDDLLLLADGRIAAHGPLAAIASDIRLLPLLHEAGLVNVLRGTVAQLRPEDGITEVLLEGGATVQCPLRPDPVGTRLELLLRPGDIALAVQPVSGLSLQNQLAGTVRAVTSASDRVLVAVDVGQELLVEVTARTITQLGIVPGRPVGVLFKAMSVTGRN